MQIGILVFKILAFFNYYYKSISLSRFTGKKSIQVPYLVPFSPDESTFLDFCAQSVNYEIDYALGFRQKELYTLPLQNITFLGNSGALVIEDKLIIESVFDRARLSISTAFRSPAVILPKKKKGIYTSVMHLPWAEQSNYHWFIDCLPRICLLLPIIKEPITLIVPQNIPDFQLQTLHFLLAGNHNFSIIKISKQEKWHISDFIFPSFVSGSMSGYLPVFVLENMRKNLWHGYQVKSGEKTRIYISRSKAAKRRILNEAELLSVLEASGFKIIYAEDYLYQEQVQLFYNAEYIVSVHGAGLTNILFAQSSKVLELHALDMVRPHYFMLCKGLNFPYSYLLGTSQDENQDFSVDLSSFKVKLSDFLSENTININKISSE